MAPADATPSTAAFERASWSPNAAVWDARWGRFGPPAREAVAGAAALDAEDSPAVGEPGILEDLARRAGLTPMRAGDVDVPYEAPDRATLEGALLVAAAIGGAPAERARPVVEAIVRDVAEPYRRADASYRFENRFRYLIAAN